MPTPSKIPRPKVTVVKKQKESVHHGKNLEQQENCQKPPIRRAKNPSKTEVKTVQQSQKVKKSPLREVNGNRARQLKLAKKEHSPKTVLHDRRGISEIKRSERNLRVTLESLEQDMESLKRERDLFRCEVEEKSRRIDDLEIWKSQLSDKLEYLESENMKKSEILESLNCDIVTGEKMKLLAPFESSLACKRSENTFASDLLLQITDIKTTLSDI